MTDPLLTARGLGARAGTHALLDAVDLRLHAGEVVAVVGESGSGKTTLGLAMQGEHRDGVRLGGSVRLRGAELLDRTDAQRRAIRATRTSYLPQHPAAVLNPVRRIGKVLAELAGLRDSSRTAREFAVHDALRTARLQPSPQLLRRYPHQLSGGQQQRVALAQSLITRPDVVVLDEPTTDLDTTTKGETADTLASIAARGTALLLLTHDLPLARQLAHHVIVMREGRIVERGPDALTAPTHEHTRRMLAAEPRLPDPTPDGADLPDSSTSRDGKAFREGSYRERRTFHEGPTIRDDSALDAGPALLRATGLTRKARDGTAILDDLDLDIPRGRCVAVVGRSGAGKTTLARCLIGLTSPQGGEISLDGTVLPANAGQRSREQRRRIQYVHQDARASFDEHRSVIAQIARTVEVFRGAARRHAQREAVDALQRLGLTAPLADRRPAELSGGQLQRAALARALLARPDVLICDEITSALDVVRQSDLLDLLAEVRDELATGVVLISHDFAAVAALADRIHVLDRGRRVESASRDDLFAHPRSPTARDLVAAAQRANGNPRPSSVDYIG